jgi:hypothetical protein
MNGAAAVLTMVVAVMSCGTPTAKNNTPNTFENVTFELTSSGLASIWVGTEFPLRILIGDESYIPLESCACVDCNGTSNSDGGAFAPQPARTEIRPGTAWKHVWNGALIGAGSDCPSLPEDGTELIAEFCFGKNVDGVDQWSGGITDIECVRTPFTLGEDTTVRAELDNTVEDAGSIPVVVENGTDTPLFAQTSDNCAGTTFFSVKFGDETINLGSVCGPCDCSEGSECFTDCVAACEAPQYEEIAVGGTVEGSFPLSYRKLYDEATYQCTQLHFVPAGTLTASICYGTLISEEFNDGYGTVGDQRCEDVEFTIEDSEVRLVVTAL